MTTADRNALAVIIATASKADLDVLARHGKTAEIRRAATARLNRLAAGAQRQADHDDEVERWQA